jgi:thiol-disulfide isomerase/thioredoxin
MRRLAFAWMLAATLFAAIADVGAAEPIRGFDAKSLEAIRAEHAGKPFVLALWSVTCEPCRDEMQIIKAAQKKFPGVAIHVVSADPPGEGRAIAAFLKRYDPGPVRRWAFADDFSERVRYSIDPGWRGELPRTYLYDARHVPKAMSGKLDKAAFEAWLGAARARPAE